MSGHSKWSTIKRKKGAIDSERSKIFQKLAKEIYVAAKQGDPNPDTNSSLRMIIEKAKGENMPNDNINRALEKAKGKNQIENFEFIRYEGYGPNGVAFMVDCLTDNKNRTASAVRSSFTKKSGNLGTSGSVAYLFEKKGLLVIEKSLEEDVVLENVLNNGALDLIVNEDNYEIYTTVEDFIKIKESLEKIYTEKFLASLITFFPITYITVDDETKNKVLELQEALEELDDVQNVYHNLEL